MTFKPYRENHTRAPEISCNTCGRSASDHDEGVGKPYLDHAFDPEAPAQFVGINRAVMQGLKCVAVACSHTFAKRIARALNKHVPNERGV